MSTRPVAAAKLSEDFVRLPDPPEPEDMNNWKYFHRGGNGAYLVRHLGNEETTIITSETYIAREPTSEQTGLVVPDLLVSFNADPAACDVRNGYVISEQGKPPDFVLEIGSESTGRRDATVKREAYCALRVPEYWRFDPAGGEYQGAPLAGDRLVEGAYEPIAIEQLDADVYQGYSAALNLHLRWERGQLGWYDPSTGGHIPTFDDERAARLAAEARVGAAEARVGTAEARATDAEARVGAAEARATDAEARVRELEAELERRRQS